MRDNEIRLKPIWATIVGIFLPAFAYVNAASPYAAPIAQAKEHSAFPSAAPVGGYAPETRAHLLPVINWGRSTFSPPETSGCSGDLIGRPLLSDRDAAAKVVPTPRSQVEAGPDAAANAAANAYYYNISQRDPAGYAAQLAAFHAAWDGDPIMSRVDGACLIGPHPTTAEVLQWAAAKWGISPKVVYAEATNDGDWNMTSVGDYGCSVGVAQVANCSNAKRPNHAIRGLNTGTGGHPLASENTCFNVDVYAAFLYKRYTGNGCARGDLAMAIQQWEGGWGVCSLQRFAQRNCHSIATLDWTTKFFGGQTVPY